METKERNSKRPAQKRPASQARTAPPKKKPVGAPVRRSATKRPGSDRARREAAARAARIKAMKQQAQASPKRRVSKPRAPMQPVVYTHPKPFNRNRLLVQLASVVAAVLAVVLCLSIFFRVETITVSGANAYSAWEICRASGIEEGDSLLTFGKARACAKIKAELPYVDTVRIGIKLPNTVNIIIEEIDVVYSIQDQDGIWWLINSDGKVMDMTDAVGASEYTKVLGVKLDDPQKEKNAVAYQELQEQPQATEEPLEPGETEAPKPLIVTEQQKLDAALNILQALELNEIVGEAASVDVSDLSRIVLWYGTRYQVNLGENDNMDYKIACLKGAVNKLSDYDSGELDISFTTWPDKVAYTPFE